MKLTGARALVTGASSGIGAASAAALAGAGARVVVTGRDRRRLAAVATTTGGRAVPADLTDPADLDRVGELAQGVDLLVCAAGVGWAGPLGELSVRDHAELTAVNLIAPQRLAARAVPRMRERGGGHLVFVSSIAAVGVHREAAYAATKAGIRAFAASLRHEVYRDHIGVTTVLPGAIDTPFFERRGAPYDRRFPRPVPPSVVADAIVRAVSRDRAEVFVPSWLTIPARVAGAAPELFHRLSRRFG